MAVVKSEEKLIFEEFRAATEDLSLDETTLLRFLRARKLDIKQADQMLRKAVEWRDEKEIESVLKWEPPTVVTKDYKLYFTGLDSENRPIYVAPIGQWDARKMIGLGHKEECVKFMYKTLELIMQQAKEHGVSQFNVIIDNDGLSFRKVAHWETIETLIRVIKEFEANYPETLKDAYCINTPSIFWHGFKFIKPLLAGNTLDKIHILDTDTKKWKAALLEAYPASSLPADYGGSAKPVDLH